MCENHLQVLTRKVGQGIEIDARHKKVLDSKDRMNLLKAIAI